MKKTESNIIIRPETPDDYDSITQINDAAFGQKNEGLLVENLRKTHAFIPQLSLVAELQNHLIGHILFYPIEIKSERGILKTLALAPMSVLPEFQKQGWRNAY